MGKERLPEWLLYIAALGPVILTLISILLAFVSLLLVRQQAARARSLQKDIANSTLINTKRQLCASILDAMVTAEQQVQFALRCRRQIFADKEQLQSFVKTLRQKEQDAEQACYRAKLFLTEHELFSQQLRQNLLLLSNIVFAVEDYQANEASVITSSAKQLISQKYDFVGNFWETDFLWFLDSNEDIKREYLDLCLKNDSVLQIHKAMEAYVEDFAALNLVPSLKQMIEQLSV